MKKENIIALTMGLLAAALLWYFYLGPKYAIKRGDQAALEALHEADLKALQEAMSGAEGEVIARSDITYPGEGEEPKDDVLAARSREEVDFEYYSKANRPPTLMEMAAAGDKRKDLNIILESADITAAAKIKHMMPEGYEAEELLYDDEGQLLEGADPKGRFTLILAPVKYQVIKDAAAFAKFTAGRFQGQYPKVDFNKDMIIFIESDSQLAHGFFEIERVDPGEDAITIYYKLNIIGSAERSDIMAHTVQPRSDKKIILQQVK